MKESSETSFFKWIRFDLPAYSYAHDLMRRNYANIQDLSLLEFAAGITPLYYPDADSNSNDILKQELEQTIHNLARAQFDPERPLSQPPWGLQAYSNLLDFCNDADRKTLQSVAFALLYSREVNGWSIRHKDGDVIVLDIVLDPLLSYLNQVTLLCQQKAAAGEVAVSGPWLMQNILPHILFFLMEFPAYKLPRFRSETMSALALRKIVTRNQIMFLIAHEMGHVILNHNGANHSGLAARPGFKGTDFPEVEYYAREQKAEFEADLYAIQLCAKAALKQVSNRPSPDPEIVYRQFGGCRLAIELLFIYLIAIEETAPILRQTTGDNLINIRRIETHPPARDRLNSIRKRWSDIPLIRDERKMVEIAEGLFLSAWLEFCRTLEQREVNAILDTLCIDEAGPFHAKTPDSEATNEPYADTLTNGQDMNYATLLPNLQGVGNQMKETSLTGDVTEVETGEPTLDIPIMHYTEFEYKESLQRTLSKKAAELMENLDFDGAMTILRDEEKLCRELRNQRELALCLSLQAEILNKLGNLEQASSLFDEVEQLGRNLNIDGYIEGSLHGRAMICVQRHQFGAALQLLQEQEAVCRRCGHETNLVRCLIGQSLILVKHLSNPEKALAKAEEAHHLAKNLGLRDVIEDIEVIIQFAKSFQSQKTNGWARLWRSLGWKGK